MMPMHWADRNINQVIASVNAIAGQNKESVKKWIMDMPISGGNKDNGNETVGDEFADRLAGIVMASHYTVAEAILNLFVLYCESGINPEKSPSFRRKILTKAIPAHVYKLQEHASDLSLRASSAKHKIRDNRPKESDQGF